MNRPTHALCDNQAESSHKSINHSKNLLSRFLTYMDRWLPAVKQVRTLDRLKRVTLGLLACQGRSTLTNSILYRGQEQKDWSADYKLFNRSELRTEVMFRTVLLEGIKKLPEGSDIEIALDDTGLPKTGTKIPQARYMHDPLAPKFIKGAVRWGIRMLHAALILPSTQGERPLALSVGFQPIPAVAKPKDLVWEGMTMAEQASWMGQKKEALLTTKAVALIQALRETLDAYGHQDRRLVMVVDGSFTNHNVVGKLPPNTALVGRFRKDSKLCLPLAVKQGKRIYGDSIPTPEEHRTLKLLPEQSAGLFYGGSIRTIRFMERNRIYWLGTKSTLMRLLIVMPIPYVVVGRRKRGYNKPGYLLTTDLETPAAVLVQAYLNRWQIEQLHHDLKDGLGVGQVQAFSHAANETVHSTMTAAYALLLLAGHDMTAGKRDQSFPPLPKWRRKPPMRITHRDLMAMLRDDLHKAEFFSEEGASRLPKGWKLPHRETYQAA